MWITVVLVVTVSSIYGKLICTKCPLHMSPSGHTNCTETFVNKYFNGTIIANCLQLHEGGQFDEGPAVCHREAEKTQCACSTKNNCNSPLSPIADFKFVDEPILEGYQLIPMISTDESDNGVPIITDLPHIDVQTEEILSHSSSSSTIDSSSSSTIDSSSSSTSSQISPHSSSSTDYSTTLINCVMKIFVTVILL
ncbi:hypothetical protein DICVIV_03630 [Dictyocaulus viviparus]|uniref:Activin types I and II receptor domain protein n=1 Tax=Dictyocaulus viviparus TaxID=29172 RepID=A0A0D8Y6K0_DICVI|nr:hypothetical protein DICVIV_03630 [Dictyocaulus viviparus]